MYDCKCKRRGILYVITSPSGGGKTSIINILKNSMDNLNVSVSYTSRPIRSGEQNGKDYFFISREEFIKSRDNNFFIEYAEVFGNFYGVPKENLENNISSGIDTIFAITYHGYNELKKLFPNDVVGIFILPKSEKDLKERLLARKTESKESIEIRLMQLEDEIQKAKEFSYFVINDDLQTAANKVSCIITAERLKYSRLQIVY